MSSIWHVFSFRARYQHTNSLEMKPAWVGLVTFPETLKWVMHTGTKNTLATHCYFTLRSWDQLTNGAIANKHAVLQKACVLSQNHNYVVQVIWNTSLWTEKNSTVHCGSRTGQRQGLWARMCLHMTGQIEDCMLFSDTVMDDTVVHSVKLELPIAPFCPNWPWFYQLLMVPLPVRLDFHSQRPWSISDVLLNRW